MRLAKRWSAQRAYNVGPRLRTGLYQFMSPSSGFGGDWTPYSGLNMTGMVKGSGWEMYEQVLRGRGYGDASFVHDTSNGGYPSWRPVGEACVDFIGLFTDAYLGHGPPKTLLEEVHRRQRRWGVPFLTRFHLTFLNFESINQSLEQNPALEPMRTVSKQHLIRCSAVNPNTDHSYVDKYERLDVPPTPPAVNYLGSHSDAIPPADDATPGFHVWECRTNSVGYASAWRDAVEAMLLSRYGPIPEALGVHGFLIDNVVTDPYYSTATNSGLITPAYTSTDYRNGTRAMLAEIRDMVQATPLVGPSGKTLKIFCNNGGYDSEGVSTAVYSWDEMSGRMSEFYFHLNGDPGQALSKTWATIAGDLGRIAPALRADEDRVVVWNFAVKTLLVNYNNGFFSDVDRWLVDPAGGPNHRSNGFCGNLELVRELARDLAITDQVVVMNARGSTKFYIGWSEALARPF